MISYHAAKPFTLTIDNDKSRTEVSLAFVPEHFESETVHLFRGKHDNTVYGILVDHQHVSDLLTIVAQVDETGDAIPYYQELLTKLYPQEELIDNMTDVGRKIFLHREKCLELLIKHAIAHDNISKVWEYIGEAEHQDGYDYWSESFEKPENCMEDFIIYEKASL